MAPKVPKAQPAQPVVYNTPDSQAQDREADRRGRRRASDQGSAQNAQLASGTLRPIMTGAPDTDASPILGGGVIV